MTSPLKLGRAPGLLLSTALLLAGASHADPLVDQGQAIASSGAPDVLACVTCHGAQGEGMAAASFPYLAGQGRDYLALQLQDFAQGTRQNPIMAPIAKALKPEQIKALAAYYAQLPQPFDAKALSAHAPTYPAPGQSGAWLANRGDWDQNIPACIQCHGPGGIGVGDDFPALAGQSAQYLQAQLLAWKSGQRAPGPLNLMGNIAARMDDAQMTAVSEYFSTLPASAQASAKGGQ